MDYDRFEEADELTQARLERDNARAEADALRARIDAHTDLQRIAALSGLQLQDLQRKLAGSVEEFMAALGRLAA